MYQTPVTEEITLKYMDIDKNMHCSNHLITVNKKLLELTIKITKEYSNILLEKAKNINDVCVKALYLYKAEEIQKNGKNLSMNLSNKLIKVSKRSLDTTIEMALDYSKILSKKFEKNIEVNELEELANDLIKKTGYCKDCSKKVKELDDVGMDAFSIMGRRNRIKKEN